MPRTKNPQQSPDMGIKKIRMWSWFINQMPKGSLETWAWWLTLGAIVLPILGGLCGWIAFELNDKISRNKEAEMTVRIAQAEAATRPKPIRDRIISQLNTISPQIIEALRSGITKGSGDLPIHVVADLQRLADEPGASAYISVRQTGVMTLTTAGQLNGVEFTMNPSLLNT